MRLVKIHFGESNKTHYFTNPLNYCFSRTVFGIDKFKHYSCTNCNKQQVLFTYLFVISLYDVYFIVNLILRLSTVYHVSQMIKIWKMFSI